HANGGIESVDLRWDVNAGGPHRAVLDVERSIADTDFADLDRAASRGRVWSPYLDQPSQIPPFSILLDPNDWFVDPDVVQDNVAKDEREHAVVEPDILDVNDLLPVHRHTDVFELDAKQQIPVKASDRQRPVHIFFGLPDDKATKPVLEPGGLRHDERHRRHTHDQRSYQRENLKGT